MVESGQQGFALSGQAQLPIGRPTRQFHVHARERPAHNGSGKSTQVLVGDFCKAQAARLCFEVTIINRLAHVPGRVSHLIAFQPRLSPGIE